MKINCKAGMLNEKGHPMLPRDEDGNVIKGPPRTLGDVAAEIIMLSEEKDRLRAYELGLAFRKAKPEICLNDSDYNYAKKILNESKTLVFASGQVLFHFAAEERHPRNQTKDKDKENTKEP